MPQVAASTAIAVSDRSDSRDGRAGFNDALDGQTSRQLELGSKWRAAGLELDATLFAIDTDDEIGGPDCFNNVAIYGHSRSDSKKARVVLGEAFGLPVIFLGLGAVGVGGIALVIGTALGALARALHRP